jgi:hypothetical protein
MLKIEFIVPLQEHLAQGMGILRTFGTTKKESKMRFYVIGVVCNEAVVLCRDL